MKNLVSYRDVIKSNEIDGITDVMLFTLFKYGDIA